MNPRVVAISLVLLVTSTISAHADTKIDISGQVRVRNYMDKKSFYPDSRTYYYNHLRARLAIAAVVDSNTTAFIQVQDSRNFEGDSLVGALSSSRSNTKNLDAHQAYLQVNRLFVDGIGLKAGRFEVKFGNERLFGVDDWDNVGLAFNGAMLSLERHSYKFSAFGLSGPKERRDSYGYTSLIWGTALRFPQLSTEALYYFENIDFHYPFDTLRLNRHTISLYGENTLFATTAEWNLAFQFGKMKSDFGAYRGADYDVSAYLFSVALHRGLPLLHGINVTVAVDYSSGDAPSTSASNEGFSAPYASHRKFGGTMGYFEQPRRNLQIWQGLIDVYGGTRVILTSEWTIDLIGHRFVRPYKEEYFTFDHIPSPRRISNEVGWEVDFTVTTTSVKGAVLQAGFSAFFAHEAFLWRRDHDPGYYAYSQMTVDF